MTEIKVIKIDVLILLIALSECISFLIYNRYGNLSRPFLMLSIIFTYFIIRLCFNAIECVKLIKMLFWGSFIIILFYMCRHYNIFGMSGLYENPNYFGIYIALNMPLGFLCLWEYINKNGNKYYKTGQKYISIFIILILCAYIMVAIMTKCRTATYSILITLLLFTIYSIRILWKDLSLTKMLKIAFKYRVRLLIACAFIILIALGICYKLLIIKQYSIIGRILIWKITCKMIFKNIITGIGCSQYGSQFCYYEYEYFLKNSIKPIENIVATTVHNSFNIYLERIAELGIIGTILYLLLWKEIAVIVYKSIKNSCFILSDKSIKYINNYVFFSACVVIAFHIMGITYFIDMLPETTIPYYACLACLVNFNQMNFKQTMAKKSCYLFSLSKKKACIILIFVVLPLISVYSLLFKYRYNDIKLLSNIQKSYINNKINVSKDICHVLLAQSDNFEVLFNCGNIFMGNNDFIKAEIAYEKALSIRLDPYILEQIGLALVKAKNEKDLFKNTIEKNNYIKAVYKFKEVNKILPWRLSPKYYLAEIYNLLSDTNNAIKYAKIVINTPLKKYTKRGVEMKKAAQEMLNELGVPCDDPGIVVFDIHDRSTWNEGKW